MPRTSSDKLTFQFENGEAAHHFWVWLCEQGEQDYWTWMESAEQEEDGDITGLRFDYSKAERGSIVVKCGRFTAASEAEPYTETDEEV